MVKDKKISTTTKRRNNVSLNRRKEDKHHQKKQQSQGGGKSLGLRRLSTVAKQGKKDLIAKEASGQASRRQTIKTRSDRKHKQQFWNNLAESEKQFNLDFSDPSRSISKQTKDKKDKYQPSTENEHHHMPQKRKRRKSSIDKLFLHNGLRPGDGIIDPAATHKNNYYDIQHKTSSEEVQGNKSGKNQTASAAAAAIVTPEKTNDMEENKHNAITPCKKPRKKLMFLSSEEEKPSRNVLSEEEEEEQKSESSVKTLRHSNETTGHHDDHDVLPSSSSSFKQTFMYQINVSFGELGQVTNHLTKDLVFDSNNNENKIKRGDVLVKINDTDVKGWKKDEVLRQCLEEINITSTQQRDDNNDQQQEQQSLCLFFRRAAIVNNGRKFSDDIGSHKSSSSSENDLDKHKQVYKKGQEEKTLASAATVISMKTLGGGKKVQQQQDDDDCNRFAVSANKVADNNDDPTSAKQIHHNTSTTNDHESNNKKDWTLVAKDIASTAAVSLGSKNYSGGGLLSTVPAENKSSFGVTSNPPLLKAKENKNDQLHRFEKQMNVTSEGIENALNEKDYEISRIAIGSMVLTEGCQVSLDGNGCTLVLSYEQTLIARNFRETTRKALNIPLTEYTFMDGKMFMYAPNGFSMNNSRAIGWTGGWIALNIWTNSGDALSKYSRSYKPESSENKTKYLVLEFRNYADAVELFAGLGRVDCCSSKLEVLQFQDHKRISECCESLIEYQKKRPPVGCLPAQPKRTAIDILGDFRPAPPPTQPAKGIDYFEQNRGLLQPTDGKHSVVSVLQQQGDHHQHEHRHEQQHETTTGTTISDEQCKTELEAQTSNVDEPNYASDIHRKKDNDTASQPILPSPHGNASPPDSVQDLRPEFSQQPQVSYPAFGQQLLQSTQSILPPPHANLSIRDTIQEQRPEVSQQLQVAQPAFGQQLLQKMLLQNLQQQQQQQQVTLASPQFNAHQLNLFQQRQPQQPRRHDQFRGTLYGDEISERAWSVQLPADDDAIHPNACHSHAAVQPLVDFFGLQNRSMVQPQIHGNDKNNLSEPLLGGINSTYAQDVASPNNGMFAPDMCQSYKTNNEGTPSTDWI